MAEIKYVLPGPGGVDRRSYPTEAPEDHFQMLTNVEVSESLGAFVTGKGTTLFSSALYGSGLGGDTVLRFAMRFYYGASGKILIGAGLDSIRYWSGAAWTTLESGITGSGGQWFAAGYDDILYMVSGAGGGGTPAMRRIDPTGPSIRQAGFKSSESIKPIPAVGAAGALTGTYHYKMTCTYDNNTAHESSGSEDSIAVTLAAQRASVELPSVAGVSGTPTGRKLYRTRAGGSEYYFLDTIASTGLVTYDDNTADTSLGAERVPTDNGIPPGGDRIIFWNGRMVVAKGKRLYFSAIVSTERSANAAATVHGAGVEIFPAGHFLDVGDDNRNITALAVQGGILVVFKDDQIWNVSGDTARDMRAWRTLSAVGCWAPRTVVHVKDHIFFVGRSEGTVQVYAYNGGDVVPVGLPIEPYILDTINIAGDTYGATMCATFYRGRYLLAYSVLTPSGSKMVADLDLRTQPARWTFHDIVHASCFVHFNGPDDSGELYYCSASYPDAAAAQKLLQFENKQTDYFTGTPRAVTATIETKWMSLGAPFLRKQIRHIEVYCKIGEQPGVSDPQPGDSLLTVARSYDLGTTEITTECSAKNITTMTKLNNLAKVMITCGGGDVESPERGYLVKLKITMQGPLEIHKVVIHADPEEPWQSHEG